MTMPTTTSARARCRLHVLGGFRVTYEEEALAVSYGGRRVLGYLAVLHRNQPATRTAIAARLWPDAPPARASSTLRSVLWRLPRPRGRTLVDARAGTAWLGPHVEVDLWESEALAETLARLDPSDAVATDLTVLEHDLLPDWDEDWLDVDRESHRQLRLHALERLAERSCGQGHYEDALAAGLRAVRAEPLRESAQRAVIAVHLAEGNQVEAVRQYRHYRHLLAAELGLPPSPAMSRLIEPVLGDRTGW